MMVNALAPQTGVPAFDPGGVTHEQIIPYCTDRLESRNLEFSNSRLGDHGDKQLIIRACVNTRAYPHLHTNARKQGLIPSACHSVSLNL